MYYSNYMFRDVLKIGFYDFQIVWDEYRLVCGVEGMYKDLIWRFMDVQIRFIIFICFYYVEYVWIDLFKKEGYVVIVGWLIFIGVIDFIL